MKTVSMSNENLGRIALLLPVTCASPRERNQKGLITKSLFAQHYEHEGCHDEDSDKKIERLELTKNFFIGRSHALLEPKKVYQINYWGRSKLDASISLTS